jgi:hypothetical protein
MMCEPSGMNLNNQPTIQCKHHLRARTGIVPIAFNWFSNRLSESISLAKVLCVLAFVLTACSPALDWRTLDIGEAAVAVTMPCKPDRATRSVPLAGSDVALSMVGCDADGGTFAVSYATLEDPAKVTAALQHWQAAVVQGLKGGASAQALDGSDVHRSDWLPRGARPLPGAVRVVAKGSGPNGKTTHMQAVWFARVVGSKLLVYHAVYFSPQAKPEVADGFFGGIFLQ